MSAECSEIPPDLPEPARVPPGVNPATGPDDWSPLTTLTGFRPAVSSFGVQRFSNLEWRRANQNLFDSMPDAATLQHDTEAVIAKLAKDADKEQNDNKIRLQQRCAEVRDPHNKICQICMKMQKEHEIMMTQKARLRKAMRALGIAQEINEDCLNLRKLRMESDVVRDITEEELLKEKALIAEVQDLYNRTLGQLDGQVASNKDALDEIQLLWADGREGLRLDAKAVGLKNDSPGIMFGGKAAYPEEQASIETWNKGMDNIINNTTTTLNNSQSLREMLDSSILRISARDLRFQSDNVAKAFTKRIEELNNCRQKLENQLEKNLKEIAKGEDVYAGLQRLGRQLDFTLKVVQTRLECMHLRPGLENCRDVPLQALINEVKNENERMAALQYQMSQVGGNLDGLYANRAELEKQIATKRNTLFIDQTRCMHYRSKFPTSPALLGR